MTGQESSDADKTTNHWNGLAQIDQAITENRLAAYRWKKTWADPWGRVKMVTVFALLSGFLAYLVIDELIL